jgi:hypothetical protein
MTKSEAFLPRDKPKSWIIFVISILAGLLIAGPLAVSGIALEIKILQSAGITLLWVCWVFGGAMWLLYICRSIAGHYKDIGSHDWREQIW